MSHPIPGHDYGEELPNRKDLRLNSLQKAMGKTLKKAGQNMKRKNESHLAYLKRMVGSKDKAIEKKKDSSRMKGWPKAKGDWFKQNGNGGKPDLPPGYKQSDLD